MDNGLALSIRTSIIRLASLYIGLLMFFVSITIYLDVVNHRKLATSFAHAANNSLLIRDLRESIAILNVASGDSFDAVAFSSVNGEKVFALPSQLEETRIKGSLGTSLISIPILSSADLNSRIGDLRFYFNYLAPLKWVIGIWLFSLLSAIPVFRRIRSMLEHRHAEILRSRELESVADFAQQIAHDIRSPLSALNLIVASIHEASEEKREFLKAAVQRINDIANGLLRKGPRPDPNGSSKKADPAVDLAHLLKSIVTEKRIEFQNLPEVEFKEHIESGSFHAAINRADFARVISNLLNNCVEALDREGAVSVSLGRANGNLEVIIQDNGRGIPPDMLNRIGQRGFSHGKKMPNSGSGLGVFHARETIIRAGGTFRIESSVGAGTVVRIDLPEIDTGQ